MGKPDTKIPYMTQKQMKEAVIPKIHFEEGKVVKVEEFCIWNCIDVGSSTYTYSDGNYSESHIDPEHGGGRPKPIERSRLEELAKANPGTLPLHKILGADRGTVDQIVANLSMNVKYVIGDKEQYIRSSKSYTKRSSAK